MITLKIIGILCVIIAVLLSFIFSVFSYLTINTVRKQNNNHSKINEETLQSVHSFHDKIDQHKHPHNETINNIANQHDETLHIIGEKIDRSQTEQDEMFENLFNRIHEDKVEYNEIIRGEQKQRNEKLQNNISDSLKTINNQHLENLDGTIKTFHDIFQSDDKNKSRVAEIVLLKTIMEADDLPVEHLIITDTFNMPVNIGPAVQM